MVWYSDNSALFPPSLFIWQNSDVKLNHHYEVAKGHTCICIRTLQLFSKRIRMRSVSLHFPGIKTYCTRWLCLGFCSFCLCSSSTTGVLNCSLRNLGTQRQRTSLFTAKTVKAHGQRPRMVTSGWLSFLGIQKTRLFLCLHGHLNASAKISNLPATLPKSAVSRPGSSTFLCSGVDRRTRDRKVAGSILGRSGRRNVFPRVNFVCWLLLRCPCYCSST